MRIQSYHFLILSILLILLISLSALPGAHANDNSQNQETNVATERPGNTLRNLADQRELLVGAAVSIDAFRREAAYKDTLRREYNVLVPENVMKFDAVHPSRETYSFTNADTLVDFAEVNGMKVRGHTLVWHSQLPAWLTQGKFTRDEMLEILHDHIKTVVGHYKGRILAWDVVNEAVEDNGRMRQTIWYKTIGPDYLLKAFQWAHEADPNAKLFYNDYNDEGINSKSTAIYEMIQDLLKQGAPIDGIGLQMHVGIDFPPRADDVAKNIDRFNELGLQVQVTEMDVKIQNGIGSTEQKLDKQAKVYQDMLRVCLQAKTCTAFLTWGFTDAYTWIPGFTGHPDAPLPFDATYKPKPAYWALLEALQP